MLTFLSFKKNPGENSKQSNREDMVFLKTVKTNILIKMY